MPAPSKFSQKIADAICERLISGRSLRSICADDDMPSLPTVHRWLAAGGPFREQYARAREVQADTLFDQILDIADTTVEGEKVKETPDGVEITRGDMIEHRRLQVDARKWMAGKLAPKKYGDKTQLEHSGELTLTPSITINGKPG